MIYSSFLKFSFVDRFLVSCIDRICVLRHFHLLNHFSISVALCYSSMVYSFLWSICSLSSFAVSLIVVISLRSISMFNVIYSFYVQIVVPIKS